MTAIDHEYEAEKAEYRRDTSEPAKPLPLYEALVRAAKGMKLEPSETATRADIAYLDGHNAALAEMEAEIASRFGALSVDELARALCGWRNGKRSVVPFDDLPEAEKAAYRDQAQAIMQLLRK